MGLNCSCILGASDKNQTILDQELEVDSKTKQEHSLPQNQVENFRIEVNLEGVVSLQSLDLGVLFAVKA